MILKHRFILCLLLSMLMTLTIACGDDSGTEGNATDTVSDGDTIGGDDTTDPTNNPTNNPFTPPPGEWVIESSDPSAEFPDCINDCENAATTVDGAPKSPDDIPSLTANKDGYAGIIDGNCHSIRRAGIASKGPDLDVFTWQARERTLIEIIVEPTGDLFQPNIFTHDGTQPMSFGAARGPGQIARTVIAAPYRGNLPFFVFLSDNKNDEIFSATPNTFSDCNTFSGGEGYGYTMQVNILPFLPGEFTNSGDTLSGEALSQQGDVKYYRFTAPAISSPAIEIHRTGNADLEITIATMSTISGQLTWKEVVYDGLDPNYGDGNPDGSLFFNGGFSVCGSDDPDCRNGDAEFIFAILDWTGGGGADYTYNVTASW